MFPLCPGVSAAAVLNVQPAGALNMNVTFVMHKPELEPEFDKLTKEANLSGLRGHRDVGGYRASLYNALPLESVNALVEVMQAFEKKFA